MPTTRKSWREHNRSGFASPLVSLPMTRPGRRQPPPASPITPVVTPPLIWIHYPNSADNRYMNAPWPEDNRDIPNLDLAEPEDEFSLWQKADMAWKEHCEEKAKARKARMERNGGATRGQRKWARRKKEKERIEIIPWFAIKMWERDQEISEDEG